MSQTFDIATFVNIVRRRWTIAFIITTIALAITCVFTYVLPPVYTAQARILVESQRIPTELAQTTVTAAAAERIQLITQRIMTRDNLLSISREFDLYTKERDNLSSSEIVEVMRETAIIEPIITGGRGARAVQQTIGFTVSFEYREAIISARVANKLVELILEQNIRSRTRRANDTRTFIENQLSSRVDELRDVEARFIDFKTKNSDSLPGNLDFKRQELSAAEKEIDEIDTKLALINQEKDILIARSQLSAVANQVDPKTGLTTAQQELEKLEINLVQLKALYSNSHPTVRRVKAQIDAVRSSSELTSAEILEPENDPPVVDEVENVSPRLSLQLSLIERQVNNLKERKAELEINAGSLRTSIARSPEVESSLEALENNRQTLKEQVRLLRSKKVVADTGQRLEEDRQAERFEVIEQATSPTEPTKPERSTILVAGAFVSLAAGIGVAFLLELIDQTIRGKAGLRKHLQLEPITTIPYIQITSEKKYRKRKTIGLFLLIFCSVAVVLASIHIYYAPLDILLLKILLEIKSFTR